MLYANATMQICNISERITLSWIPILLLLHAMWRGTHIDCRNEILVYSTLNYAHPQHLYCVSTKGNFKYL